MNRLKYGILIIILLTLNSCKSLMNRSNIDGDSYQDDLYYEYDYDYYDQDDFDRG